MVHPAAWAVCTSPSWKLKKEGGRKCDLLFFSTAVACCLLSAARASYPLPVLAALSRLSSPCSIFRTSTIRAKKGLKSCSVINSRSRAS